MLLLLQLLFRFEGSGGSAVNGAGFGGGVGVTGVWRTDLVLSVKFMVVLLLLLLLSLFLVAGCWPEFCETGGRGGRESGLTGALSPGLAVGLLWLLLLLLLLLFLLMSMVTEGVVAVVTPFIFKDADGAIETDLSSLLLSSLLLPLSTLDFSLRGQYSLPSLGLGLVTAGFCVQTEKRGERKRLQVYSVYKTPSHYFNGDTP